MMLINCTARKDKWVAVCWRRRKGRSAIRFVIDFCFKIPKSSWKAICLARSSCFTKNVLVIQSFWARNYKPQQERICNHPHWTFLRVYVWHIVGIGRRLSGSVNNSRARQGKISILTGKGFSLPDILWVFCCLYGLVNWIIYEALQYIWKDWPCILLDR